MEKIMYRLIYNRKNHLNGEGKALIQVEAYFQKQKVYFSTHIYVFPEQWDGKKKRIIQHPQAEALNRMLEEFILSLQMKELEGWKKGHSISLDLLKEKKTMYCISNEIVALGRKWVENSSRKASTKQNINTTLSLLDSFKPKISFELFDYALLYEFESFLRDKQISTNTIGKHMRHLKTIINEAIRLNILSPQHSPFRYYKVRKEHSGHKYLLPEEVALLENCFLIEKKESLQHSLDAFLFCCYTGLRYSDFIQMSRQNLQKISSEEVWLSFNSEKTGTFTQIPLHLLFQGKALKILKKYPHIDSFFQIKPNSSLNKDLIKIGRICGIKKHFSFHTARHTNATLLIYKGIPITTVQKLLGHRSVKTTEVYSEILPKTIVNDLKKASLENKKHKQL